MGKPLSRQRLAAIELFVAGVSLTASVGYVLEGSGSGAVLTFLIAALLTGHAIAQGAVWLSWLLALGLFSSLSKLDIAATERAFGDLRIPIMVGGSALALLIGVFQQQRRALAAKGSFR
jgi:hypothetical protein